VKIIWLFFLPKITDDESDTWKSFRNMLGT